MTPEEFAKLRRAMQWAGFTIDKKQCVADSKGRLSGTQIAQVMDNFSFVNDKMDVLQLLAEHKRIEQMSCGEAKMILERFSFVNEKHEALKYLAKRVRKGYGEGSEMFDEFNMQGQQPSTSEKKKEDDTYEYFYDEHREEKDSSDSDGGDWYDTGDVDDGDDGPGDDGGDDDD